MKIKKGFVLREMCGENIVAGEGLEHINFNKLVSLNSTAAFLWKKVADQELTAEQMAQYQKAQNGVSSALSKLLLVVEKYPDLKANQNFLELQSQLEGTENRITVARRDFNGAAKEYNTAIRKFPKNILAGMFGFEKKAYFEAQEGTEKAPEVQF